jgi:hypothetical protein
VPLTSRLPLAGAVGALCTVGLGARGFGADAEGASDW